MKFIAIALLLAVLPMSVAAQGLSPFGNRGEIDLENTYHPPRVFVPEATVEVAEGGKVSGTFNAYNSESFIATDLDYRLELMSPAAPQGEDVIRDDTVIMYDNMVVSAGLTLLPLETRQIEFEYDLPSVPAGTYRLRISMTSSLGRDLGWFDAELQVPDLGVQQIIELLPGPFIMPEFPDTVLEPLSGPNVSGGNTFEVQAEITSEQAITVTPVLDIHEFDNARPRIDQVVGNPIALRAGQPHRFTLPVTAEEDPEVYFGILWLRGAGGEKVSSIAPYRWVVRGADADVLWITMDRIGNKAGDTTIVNVDFVGAPDAETKVSANVTVSLEDDEGVLAFHTEENVSLTDSLRSGKFHFQPQRGLVGTPRVKVVITEGGQELLSREVPFNLSPEQIESAAAKARQAESMLRIGAMLMGAGVVVLGYFVWSSRKKRRK